MGYTVLSGVVMTPYLHQAAATIADKLPFDITITSGVRTARKQAAAMFGIIEAGGSLRAVYADDSFADQIAAAYPDMDLAESIVQSYFDRGLGSSHGRGQGIDIRTTGGGAGATNRLTETQISQVIQAVSSVGFNPLREYSPPHVHVTLPPEKKSLFLIGLIGLGGLAWIMKK